MSFFWSDPFVIPDNTKKKKFKKKRNKSKIEVFISQKVACLFEFVTSTTNLFYEDLKDFKNSLKTETVEVINDLLNGSDHNSKIVKDSSQFGSIHLGDIDQIQNDQNKSEKDKEGKMEKIQQIIVLKQKENKNQISPKKVVEEYKKALFQLQSNQGTYTKDPEDHENFFLWKQNEHFKLHTREIEVLLSENKTVGGMFLPDRVMYEDFWNRYFFQLELLRRKEKEKKLLKAIQESTESSKNITFIKNEEIEEEENNKTSIFGEDPNSDLDNDVDKSGIDSEETETLYQELSELSDLNEEYFEQLSLN
ncbi:bsd domain-containing protein [Anaeramoeba flamelloides]|uniref:Bsd domain-containing protein n=1 Tax=Anaeramoeba flamelloides TaxID=1746091 RepID=A0ABQ8ZA18_9EUKA|nr:bsd domain-containing protein [Anaeramoeba flamelloides]